MARGKDLLPINTVVMLVFMVVIGLFLFSKFFENVGGEWQFRTTVTPSEAEESALTITQILIVGAMTMAVFYIAPKFGADLGQKSAFSLIIVGVVAFLAYKYVLNPILTATNFSGIDWKLAQKLGLL